jgi:hypothetical protein
VAVAVAVVQVVSLLGPNLNLSCKHPEPLLQ